MIQGIRELLVWVNSGGTAPVSRGPGEAGQFENLLRERTNRLESIEKGGLGEPVRGLLDGADGVDQLEFIEKRALSLLNRSLDALLPGAEQEDGENADSGLSSLSSQVLKSLQSFAGLLNPGQESAGKASGSYPGNPDLESLVGRAADRYGVDPELIRAVIQVESGGNPQAVSPKGAQGLMQLMPGTAADLGVTDAMDPAQNVMAGARYLRQLLDRYQGNTGMALAAYNWGMSNLERNPRAMPEETRNYLARIEGCLTRAEKHLSLKA